MKNIFKFVQNWAVEKSLTAYVYKDGCCSFLENLLSNYIQNTSNPHHADLLVVSGIVNKKSIAVLEKIYNQMPAPKYILTVGNCSINGGIFKNNDVIQLKNFLPVSVEIPGCPVSSDSIRQGIKELRNIIRRE
ncbi:MAG: hypothetical protein MJ250_01390 [Alphaproteobacteria bacterium]|nr:hypothetical protein [Alphaproteobacteria bacterium]